MGERADLIQMEKEIKGGMMGPEEIHKEIDKTRAEMSETIERVKSTVQEEAIETSRRALAIVRKPLLLLGAGIGIGFLSAFLLRRKK